MRKVYFDNAATTQPLPKVVEAMHPYFTEAFGNPPESALIWPAGKKGNRRGKGRRPKLINAKPSEIIFTSTGTEANNFAIKGAGRRISAEGETHNNIRDRASLCDILCKRPLRNWALRPPSFRVDQYVVVDPDEVRKAITSGDHLVSVMHANNEIGTIQPISEISRITKKKGVVLHTDAAMSVGNIPVDVAALGVDLLTISAHKFYGPKGVGALYVKKGVRIAPFIHGGIQEDGRRAGADQCAWHRRHGQGSEIAIEEMPERVKR